MSQIIFLGTGGGPTPGVVLTLTGNNPVAVPPDGLGNINIVNANTTVNITGNAGTNTLTQDFGISNLILGSDASNITVANRCTGVGFNALSSVTGASSGTAIGWGSLQRLTTGNVNTAIGDTSLFFNTTGAGNTSCGYTSMNRNVSGNFNTTIGMDSLSYITTSDLNVAVGFYAGRQLFTGENNLYLANSGVDLDNNTIRIGRTVADTPANPHTSAYIAGVANVTVSNQEMVVIDTTTGQLGSEPIGTGTVLTLTGNSGGAVSPTAGNINIVNANTNVAIVGNPGTSTLTQDFGLSNLFIGTSTPSITTANNCVSLGFQALNSVTSSQLSVAIGSQALQFTSTGNVNTAVGAAALRQNTTGGGNSALGTGALEMNTTGNFNTAIGQGSLNTIIASSDYNVALGDISGRFLTSGSNNLYLANSGASVESNTIRVGRVVADGVLAAHTANYMGGVLGNTISGSIVNIDGTTAQLGVTAMTSDSSGRVTNASQPLFSVYNNNAIVNVTGDNTIYTIIFDTTDVNQGSVFNAGTGTFTAPITGRYLFGLTCTVSNLSSGHNEGKVFIVTTPRTYTGNWVNPFVVSTGGAGIYTFTTSVLVSLTASQTAQFQVQVSNSTKTVNVAGGIYTYAYGYLVA